jgi:hypothetical protein
MTPGQIWQEQVQGVPVPDSEIHLQHAPEGPPADRAAKVIQGLRARGLDAEHAAILAGNIQQESDFDPTLPNVAEGGIGLIQWRLDRRRALQEFAKRKGTAETDRDTQLDFLMSELNSPAGAEFKSATSLTGMNSALHHFIRYGDRTEPTRLAYGRRLLPLAEQSGPGSLLAAAGKSGLGGTPSSVNGSAAITIDVTGPHKSVRAETDGDLFKRLRVNRGLAMPAENFE